MKEQIEQLCCFWL